MIIKSAVKTVLEGVSFNLRVEELDAIGETIKAVREAQESIMTILENVANPEDLSDFEVNLDITINTLESLVEGYVEV